MYKYKGQIFIIGECFRDPVIPEKEGFVGYSDRPERQGAKGLPESIPEQEEEVFDDEAAPDELELDDE
jgi:hypothetical protein